MRIQVIFLALTASLATTQVFANCFDFGTKVTKPLHPVTDKQESGKRDDDMTWATARGTVEKPIRQVLDLILDHNNTKSPRVDEMEVEKIDDPNYLARHKVKFLIKPFLFVKIRWTEDWGYVVTRGTAEQPAEVTVSYEKTEGTSHIEHLCGNFVLRKLSDKTTDVFQYEEAKATKRSAEDTLNGLLGTLKTLRK